MKKNYLVSGVLCISIGVFLFGCKNQTAVPSTSPETVSENVSSENVSSGAPSENGSSENVSSTILPSSDSEKNSKKIILYTYDGKGNPPDRGTGNHKLVKELPENVKEITETVSVPSDEVTPDKVMKLYVEKFLIAPVGNGTMSFSYSGATMSKDGIITVDFTKEGARYLSYGTTLEQINLYGIGKTMLINVEGAKAICYGIEGGNYQTEMVLKRDTPYLTK